MLALSDRTKRLINRVFADEATRNTVMDKLVNECGIGVPFCEKSTPEEMDRIRFSVVKLSEGDVKKLESAIELANVDWRDLFMAAGFGHDVEEHNKWYEETVGN